MTRSVVHLRNVCRRPSRVGSLPGAVVAALLALPSTLLLPGCQRGGAEGAHGTTTSGATEPLTCTVDGLAGAELRPPLVLPAGCAFTQGGTVTAPRVLRTAEEVLAALSCPQTDLAALGIDPTQHDVYVLGYTMSPASAGQSVYDDGQTLTYVSRFRPPCPNDPMPMPMNATVAWLMPKDATRATREASCSLPERCD
ncbi:MAG: hypothetical protein KC593_11335 [Myxococcales bacterium]|nr:hypothetical protein [Myxococcales bacterium]MCB9629566.1 hypothetical protein [Sandaracinaceae bacterium]